MKAKILELMQREGLKPSQLAEMLEISPAIISHILSERNKPSLDLLCKILRRFPQINPDWLLLDAPEIYRPGAEDPAGHAPAADDAKRSDPQGALFDVTSEFGIQQRTQGTTRPGSAAGNPGANPAATGGTSGQAAAGVPAAACGESGGFRASGVPVTRVVICYADGTCESYLPTRP